MNCTTAFAALVDRFDWALFAALAGGLIHVANPRCHDDGLPMAAFACKPVVMRSLL